MIPIWTIILIVLLVITVVSVSIVLYLKNKTPETTHGTICLSRCSNKDGSTVIFGSHNDCVDFKGPETCNECYSSNNYCPTNSSCKLNPSGGTHCMCDSGYFSNLDDYNNFSCKLVPT